MMQHKGYAGRVEFDDEAGVFHGQVVGTRDVITFQGTSADELRQAFRDSVDDYLAFCAERGEKPDKPFSGKFVVRVRPELHRRLSAAAEAEGESQNAWVTARLEAILGGGPAAPKKAASTVVVRAGKPKARAKKSPAGKSAKSASAHPA